MLPEVEGLGFRVQGHAHARARAPARALPPYLPLVGWTLPTILQSWPSASSFFNHTLAPVCVLAWCSQRLEVSSSSRTPGPHDPRTPGSTTPGSRTPGSTTPGSTTPGSTTPGSTTPCFKVFQVLLGMSPQAKSDPRIQECTIQDPRINDPRIQIAGSTTPGFRTPGSTTSGPTTPAFKFFEVLLGRSPQTKFHPRIQDPGGFLCPEKPTAP